MRRNRRRGNDDFGWAPYVPVAQRRAQAVRETNELRKKGQDIQPVEIEGRTIAHSFWGKGWCAHLESFGDYRNRLPRGRTYVRNGSVCHLGIEKGTVEAMVSGSDLYRITVEITPLKKAKWNRLKKDCTGKIGSLIELLQGRLSEEIMRTVIDRSQGLFPLPGEITYHCDCPDWADMCKHIAAVMYGIGARLDDQPELLFLLRGVDHQELISSDAAADAIVDGGTRRGRRRDFAEADLESVFGVELEDVPTAPKPARPKTGKPKTRKRRPLKPTAKSVAALRRRLGMTQDEFARAVGVSSLSVTNWEKATGPINMRSRSLEGLTRLHDQDRESNS